MGARGALALRARACQLLTSCGESRPLAAHAAARPSQAELKHARICMLAVVGWVSVDLGFRVPYAPEVSSLAAHDATVDKGPMTFLLLVLSVIEISAGIPKARAAPVARRSAAHRAVLAPARHRRCRGHRRCAPVATWHRSSSC